MKFEAVNDQPHHWAFFTCSLPRTADAGTNLFLTAFTICVNQKKFNRLKAVFPIRYTLTNHIGSSPSSQLAKPPISTRLEFDVHFPSSSGTIRFADVAVKALYMSEYIITDWYVPQTILQKKNETSSKMPLYNCSLEPVSFSLSQNQWMFRNGVESS
jgi:hypothetical protein